MELQDKTFTLNLPRDKKVDSFLLERPLYQTLEKEEKLLFYWVNVLRSNPSVFGKTVVQPFLLQFPEANSSYSKSLIRDLENCGSLPMLEPNAILLKAGRIHVKDLALHQKELSHFSSDGKNFQQRMSEAGILNCAGENLYEGKKDALFSLLILLIDQGVSNKGHREALLNSRFNQMGVAYASQQNRNSFLLVQIFSCSN